MGPAPRLPRPVRRTVEAILNNDADAGLTDPSPATLALLESVLTAHAPWVDTLDMTHLQNKQA